MSYGLIYTAAFDSLKGDGYTIDIYKKDYGGADSELLLGGVPIIHKWDDDNPHAAIKGSSCEIEIVSLGINLADFYSNEDDTFKIIVSHETLGTRFTGFLVQDESSEIEVDYAHIIRLVFTDGLGVLKDIDLLTASRNIGTYINFTRDISTSGDQVFVSGAPFGEPGQTLIISGGTAVDGTYTINRIENPLGVFIIYITGIFPASVTLTGVTLTIITPVDISGRMKYSEIIPLCLKSTGLFLNTFVYSKLIPNDYVVGRWLESTLVDAKTFLDGEKWDSCYTILEKICKTFNATLFQAEGYWQIIRWDELRYQDNAVTWYAYDSDFTYLVLTGSLGREFTYGNGSDIATGLLSSIQRPYRLDKRTFNYVQPDNLIYNGNWLITGNIITSYTSGSDTIYEYDMIGWDDYGTSPSPTRRIRVVIDSDGDEKERYGFITGTFFDDTRAAQSQPIEMSSGDQFDYSFSFRTNVSQTNVSFGFAVRLTDGTNNRYLDNNGRWVSTPRFPYQITPGDNSNIWQQVTMKTEEPLPFSGVIYIYLANWAIAGPMETQYKDLSLKYTPATNNQKNIIGHIHNDEQSLSVNNINDNSIYIDDAPRSSIKGCQFLDSMTGVIQTKTTLWGYDTGVDGTRRLGEITTFETLFFKRIPRLKLEGDFLGLIQSPNLLSMLSVVEYQNRPGKWFIWGQLEINYKNDTATGTLYEQWEEGEVDGDLTDLYTFKYLYETK